MRDVSKAVKKHLNENDDYNDDVFAEAIDYLKQDNFLYNYYKTYAPKNIKPSMKIYSMSQDGNTLYYNPEWISELSPEEVAFVLMHHSVHYDLSEVLRDLDNETMDKIINRYVEYKFPIFKGMTRKMNGII